MPDDRGVHHRPDDEPITWREFEREMAHRDRLAEQKEHDLQREVDRKAKDVLDITEKRAASNRLLVAIVGILVPLLFGVLTIWFSRR